MAETIHKILEKKKVLSSSSEETSPPIRTSKNRKKPRGSTFTFDQASNHEGDINSVTTPEMPTNIDAKLEVILLKLEKLDAIETSVKGLQDTLARMDDRIRALESVQATSNQDINDLKGSLSFAEDQQRKTTEGFDRYKEQINLKMTELSRKNAELDSNIKDLENKNLYLEAYSRRENIKFENIQEETRHGAHQEDTENVLRSFLETHLGYEDAGSVEIQRVHRIKVKKSNASNDTKPKPIIARFLRYKDCERILSLGHRLKGTEFRMYQDLPHGIVERRRKQMDTFKLAKRNKIPAAFSKSQPDKLYIRGKLWPVGKPLDLSLC